MDEFAIDLDKVLDEFEEREGIVVTNKKSAEVPCAQFHLSEVIL